MNDIIKNIIEGKNIKRIMDFVVGRIYRNGPVSIADMEILTYLKIYHPKIFLEYESDVISFMGLFYKKNDVCSLRGQLFSQYKEYIREIHSDSLTPVQSKITKGIETSNFFSFSAPTSTGKSYVFMREILKYEKDVVIVVPSRALINEYYLKISKVVTEKSINVLTFIDKINTKYAKRNIFIVTPERCRELFKKKNLFHVQLFLFDEAQLSNEDSKRGIYFDSIVRRCYKSYPDAKFVFAHPFIKNPESQIIKNKFDADLSGYEQYTQKNVGQIFYALKNNKFFHFGIEKEIMGLRRLECNFDPIKNCIDDGGSVLFYVTKSSIYSKKYLSKFKKYINLCSEIKDKKISDYIDSLKQYTGGDTNISASHYSMMLSLLKRGIVIHHGSLPLQTRLIVEQFTKDGFCKLCFATSTLEQGINMPFDIVFIDRLEASKPLSVKNLIGRAGRSTEENKFDYGCVILNGVEKISKFRSIMKADEILDDISGLDKNDQHDNDYDDFKDAILNNTYSDEFNLTENELKTLSSKNIQDIIEEILNKVFHGNEFIPFLDINNDIENRLPLYKKFSEFYSAYLGRNLGGGEIAILETAIKIMIWRVYGKSFKNICWYRYSYASKSSQRLFLEKNGIDTSNLEASFFMAYQDFPNINLQKPFSALNGVGAKNVDYDFIMYDTYDYIDKLIGFKLTDVFFAAFIKYFVLKKDERANKLAKYMKYGTDNERHILMLRYGMEFEDIEVLDEHILEINEEEIIFKDSIRSVESMSLEAVSRFIQY